MSYNDKKCPACGESYYGGVCDKCGYIHIIMPNTVPKSLQDMLNEQVQVIKQRCLCDKRAQNQIEELRGELDKANKEAQGQIEKLKEELAKAGSARKSDLRGVVVIEDTKLSVKKILPIYEGENTYGTNQDQGTHINLRWLVLGYKFKPVHFKIKTSDDGLLFENLSGEECYKEGILYVRSEYLRENQVVKYNDGRFEITVSEINN